MTTAVSVASVFVAIGVSESDWKRVE